MTPPRASVQKLAEKLIGMGDEEYEVEELSLEECHELDSVVFRCVECDHWYPQRDNANRAASEWKCRGCMGC